MYILAQFFSPVSNRVSNFEGCCSSFREFRYSIRNRGLPQLYCHDKLPSYVVSHVFLLAPLTWWF